MKKFIIITLVAGVVTVGMFIQSCTKEKKETIPDSSLASATREKPVNSGDLSLLGKEIFFDNISVPNRQSCASCHAPEYGFTGPNSGENLVSGIYRGAVATRAGGRKPPSAAYATFAPVFHYDEDDGTFEGGNFWDGRATGETLGNPAAEQALGPFLNPVEQNHPSKESVLKQIAASSYAALWNTVWNEPISFNDASKINLNYNRVGLSIAAYEASPEVNAFTSKFDYYIKGMVQLTPEEMEGLVLFNGKAGCAGCHPSDGDQPLFTDFTYDNLGVPKNLSNPFYGMNSVSVNGEIVNPLGSSWIDPGLGGFLSTSTNAQWRSMAADNMGKHKVPTLRNVDKKPGEGNTKAYTHNGVFKSLKEVVDFYNTRDVKPWPSPEVSQNVNREELGNLQLTDHEVNSIIAFMKTLSDGYRLKNN
jgi:cytochrome c peroxidase